MMEIYLYEPAMCCSTGICGADVDPELLRISTLSDTLKQEGITMIRYNLSSNPQAFVSNDAVKALLAEGNKCLPITIVNGEVMKQGSYPSNLELEKIIHDNKSL